MTKRQAKTAAVPPEELARRRERVRLVRRLSKWITKLDGVAADAAKLRRDGVAVPVGWGFGYDAFLSLLNPCRKCVTDALASATDKGDVAAGCGGFIDFVVRHFDELTRKKLAALIDEGKLDGFGHSRAKLRANAEYAYRKAEYAARLRKRGAADFFALMGEGGKGYNDDELADVPPEGK